MSRFPLIKNLLNPFRNWRLQNRLFLLLLFLVTPMVFVMPYLGRTQIITLLEDQVLGEFEAHNQVVAVSTRLWLDAKTNALLQMVSQDEIKSMDPAKQEAVLKTVAALNPDMYLVSTTYLSGMNAARSDGAALADYRDRDWLQQARLGAPLTYQILIGRTSRQPAVVVSTPIRNDKNNIVGVGMFASDLDVIKEQVKAANLGETGFTYVIDEKNQIVAHPDSNMTAELRDASDSPAVKELRSGKNGLFRFEDENGKKMVAFLTTLDNGWGVITQQEESEAYELVGRGQMLSFLIIIISVVIVTLLVGFVITQIVAPISRLTETVTAIAAGDFTRRSPAESHDEIGRLGEAFNVMTDRLRQNLVNLERLVAERTVELQARTRELETSASELEERTKELDMRSNYLQTTVDVNRFVSTILDPNSLTSQVVELIRERFNLYYVGLFLVDSNRERAWLKAGTGDAGQSMLERKHSIRVGSGMVGWAIENARPRIALQAAEDEVRLATPDLPETRSEVALPLRSRDTVIGALTLQSSLPNDFDDENIAVFQSLADQVAIAIDNARLYSESQGSLESLRAVYAQQTQDSWERLAGAAALSFRSDALGVVKAGDVWYPEMEDALQQGKVVMTGEQAGTTSSRPLALPIRVRGQVVGVLDARKDAKLGLWGDEDIDLIEAIVEQLGVALESAQLYQETQNRAERERLVAEITGKLRASNDPQVILQAAASELRRALRAKDARVSLRSVTRHETSDNVTIGFPEQPAEPDANQAASSDRSEDA